MNLRREVSAALKGRGYVRKDRNHLLRIDDDRSWVVDTGPLDSKRTDIVPFAGIRFDSVETLLTDFWEVPPDDASASIGANVGYVLGIGYKTYIPPTRVDNVLADIDAAHQKLSPYMTIETFGGFWKASGVYDPGWRYRDIIWKLLTRRYSEIEPAFVEARKEFCEFDDAVCAQFRRFEQNVRKRMV